MPSSGACSLKFIDLFSGGGAMSLGFEREGYTPIMAIDNDPEAARVYAANRPGVPVLMMSAADIDPEALAAVVGDVDVVIGGVPWMDLRQPSRGLVGWTARVVDAIRPRFFVFENVATSMSSEEWQAAKSQLAELGYDVDVWVLRADQLGVAQARKRAFLVGAQGTLPPQPAPLPLVQSTRMALAGLSEPTADNADELHRGPLPVRGRAAEGLDAVKPGAVLPWRYGDVVADPDFPARTITSASRVMHWNKERWLTVREHARLQDFPDSYAFPTSMSFAREIVGRAVPVGMAAAVARALKGLPVKNITKPAAGPRRAGAFVSAFDAAGWATEGAVVEKAIFGSPSSKKIVAKKIAALLPPHTTYVEPFAGSAAVLFAKEPAAVEVVADLNPDITRAYKAIRGLDDAGLARLEAADWSGNFDTWKQLKDSVPADDVDHLRRFLYVQRFSLGGFNNHRAFRHDDAGVFSRAVDRVKKNLPRMRGLKVIDGDYRRAVDAFDDDDVVFFMDPPYAGKDAGVGEGTFDESGLLKTIDGMKGRFVLTYTADSDLVGELQKRENLDVRFFETDRVMSRWRGGDPKVRHVLAANFPLGETDWLSKERPLAPTSLVAKAMAGEAAPAEWTPLVLVQGHNFIVDEINRRGMPHDSPIEGTTRRLANGNWELVDQPTLANGNTPIGTAIDDAAIEKSIAANSFIAPEDVAVVARAALGEVLDTKGRSATMLLSCGQSVAARRTVGLATVKKMSGVFARHGDDTTAARLLGGSAGREWIGAIMSRFAEVAKRADFDSAINGDGSVELDVFKRASDDAVPEERTVTGIVLEPDGVDAQGDTIDADTIKRTAHRYLSNYNATTKLGFMHNDFSRAFELLESWLVPEDMTLFGRQLRKGTWVMTVRVLDEEVWRGVKKGRFKGFSIGGVARVQRFVPAL